MDIPIQLVDLLPDIIDQNDPMSQYIISSHKEFRILEGLPYEENPIKGDLFRHQEFFKRIMKDFRNQFVIDDPGTGKSCLVNALADYLFEESEKRKKGEFEYDERNAFFNEVIYIGKSDTLLNEFQRQVIERCSLKYERLVKLDPKFEYRTEKGKKQVTEKIFTDWFSLLTYGKFSKIVENLTDEEIEQSFSNKLFIVDEAHNLIIEPNSISGQQRKDKVYENTWRAFHKAKNVIRILLSATPMINKSKEIISLMNLILDEDEEDEDGNMIRNQMPRNMDIDRANLEDLKKYFLSNVSYVRSLESGAEPVEVITDPDEITVTTLRNGQKVGLKLNLTKSYMSDFQTKGYMKIIKEKMKNNNTSLDLYEIYAQLMVFPDGFSGSGLTEEEKNSRMVDRRILKDIKKNKNKNELERREEDIFDISDIEKRGWRKYIKFTDGAFDGPSDDFIKHFNGNIGIENIPKLRELSCKMADSIDVSLKELGNIFIYAEPIESGIYTYAACLELCGVERFNSKESVFVKKGNEKIISSKFRKSDGSKENPWRYAIYHKGMSKRSENALFEIMNSDENKHGEYIKYFICTRKARDGINVFNVIQIHILSPTWHEAGLIQARARGLRVVSHDALIKELREKYGYTIDAKIKVKLFNWCAMLPENTMYKGMPVSNADFHRYLFCKEKDYSIRRILRIMKQCASGCQLNKKRNIRKGIDFSSECDYNVCDYECVGPIFDPSKDNINERNYNLFYNSKDIKNAANKIFELFRLYNILLFQDLIEMCDEEPIHIALALEKIVINKIKFLDKFGYPSYLLEDNGCFYIDRNYPHDITQSSCSMSYYSQGINAIDLKNLKFKINEEEEDISIIIENIILKIIKDEELSDEEIDIYNKYKLLIYKIGKPMKLLHKQEDYTTPNLFTKPGKKAEKFKRISFKDTDLESYLNSEDHETNFQYLHIIDAVKKRPTEYASTSRYDKADCVIRILDIDKYLTDGVGWRDVSEIEFPVYQKLISGLNKRLYDEYSSKFEYYGVKLPEKELIIRDERNPGKKDKKGSICAGKGRYTEKELYNMMWEMGIDLQKYTPIKLDKPGRYDMDQLRSKVSIKATVVKDNFLPKSGIYIDKFEDWGYDRLLYYHNIIKGFPRDNEEINVKFCNILEQEFRLRNQLIE